MVSNHACVRVHKMALPLIESGRHTVNIIAHKQTSFIDSYSTFGHWLDIGQLHNLIKLYAKDTDVFHCHNEPSFFVTLIKETCDIPVILDVHDSFAARNTPEDVERMREAGQEIIRITAEERNNFQLADALVFPGQSFGELVTKEFNLTQPSIVLPSYLPRRMYRYNIQDWLGGLVYEGKVQLSAEGKASYGFRYCDYLELAKKCHEIGMDFHLYGGRDDKEFMATYNDIAFVHAPVAYEGLIRDIARHDWGLVGNIMPNPEWDVAMPNKLFEYIAAGVPVVAINAKECEEFVVKHGVGISVKSIDELAARWNEHTEIRKHLLKTRAKFSMEMNIEGLENLYRSFII